MTPIERRFHGFEPDEVVGLVKELEEDCQEGGRRLLMSAEVEELIGLLSADHFRLSRRLRIKATRRGWAEFSDTVRDVEGAAANLSDAWVAVFLGDDEDAAERLLRSMDRLRVLHPALWFRAYRSVHERSLAAALELEAPDKDRPFNRP